MGNTINLGEATADAEQKTVKKTETAPPPAVAATASTAAAINKSKKGKHSAVEIVLGAGSKRAKQNIGEQPKFKKMSEEEYLKIMEPLHIELVKMQNWVKESGAKILSLYEGRDASGKGGTIKRFIEHLNPRGYRVVALDKPTDKERSQWYFQRYAIHLPAAGELVFFDRSWYNRSGVERVMGFCTEDQVREYLRSVPEFERMLVNSGIILFKFYFSVSKEEQLRRFTSRADDPLKQWKLSPVDRESQDKWDAYTKAKEDTFFYTSTEDAPWTIIKSNDKKRARINSIKYFLSCLDYPNKNKSLLDYDKRIIRTVREEIGID
ncbi:MAG: polyphosphate kinase 2 [Magnetococcales bacterium]|nr:polyphosphate kinase 2 [Magnetococcales bacterium]